MAQRNPCPSSDLHSKNKAKIKFVGHIKSAVISRLLLWIEYYLCCMSLRDNFINNQPPVVRLGSFVSANHQTLIQSGNPSQPSTLYMYVLYLPLLDKRKQIAFETTSRRVRRNTNTLQMRPSSPFVPF